MPLIKICGITKQEEILYLNEAMPDFAGFVQYFPKSKRNIPLEEAQALIEKLDKNIKSVAVTVNPNEDQLRAIEGAGFDYIQIHGDIDEALFDSIKIPVIKAFNVSDIDSIHIYDEKKNVYGYVFDASVPGSGKIFDWDILDKFKKLLSNNSKFTLIAGGINCENASEALVRTGLSGVDTSSGVENDNGIGKSKDKILKIVSAVRGI